MAALGSMVHEGISPGELDKMDLEDVSSWYRIMSAYHEEVKPKPTPQKPRR